MNELEEFQIEANESSRIYMERATKFYDLHNNKKEYYSGDKVLLFNTCLCFFLRKLKLRWRGPYTIMKIYRNGMFDICGEDGNIF